MPTGMGATDPKLVKESRKLKKEKHCTILNLEQNEKKIASKLKNRILNKKWKKKKVHSGKHV